MHTLGVFFQEMLVLYGVALLGFFVRRKGILNDHANDVITKLLLNITLPALILFSLDLSFSPTMLKDFLWLFAMSFYILTLSIIIAGWLRKRAKLPENRKSVYEGLIIFGNQGFIGFAVSYILMGEQGIVYLTMFNLCYLILIWTYGIYLFSKSKNTIVWKNVLLNPGTLSTLTGFIVFLLPFRLPAPLSNGLEMVGKMTIPLSMMMIGILLAKIKWGELLLFLKNIHLWIATSSRLLLIPLLLLPFAALPIPTPLLVIAIIVSGMPAAPTISLYAQRYKHDSIFSSFGVLLTTLLCILTIPLLYLVTIFIR